MSDNCCLPFDVTLYIFKVSVVTVFIKYSFNVTRLKTKQTVYPETKCLFLVSKVDSFGLKNILLSFLSVSQRNITNSIQFCKRDNPKSQIVRSSCYRRFCRKIKTNGMLVKSKTARNYT